MRKLVALTIVLLSFACASGPVVSPDAEEAAKKFAPLAKKGQLYVVRPTAPGVTVHYQVKVDGRVVGSLPLASFLVQELNPGLHQVILFNPTTEIPISVEVEAGKNYYLRVGMSATASKDERTTLVSEEEGRVLVRTSAMVASSQAH